MTRSLLQSIFKHPLISSCLVILILFALSTHLLYLGTFPPALAHDEVEYQLSAKTFSIQGTDLSGYGFPKNLISTETEGNVSTIPVIILSIFQGLLHQTMLTARLPYFFLSIATAIILYFFVQTLFRNKYLSLITSLLFLINPWAFFLSRYATESPFALLFLLIAMTLLLRFTGKKLLWSYLFFFFAFFSYHAAKLIIPLIVAVLLLFRAKADITYLPKLNTKQAFCFFAAILILLISFLTISKIIPHSNLDKRGGDIVLFNSSSTTSLVDTSRKSTVESNFTPFFVNKYMLGGREIMTRYLNTFSPQVLFLEGDLRAVYGYFYHGLFFIIDAFFILTGVIFLSKNQPKLGLLLLSLALIAPIPSALNQYGTSYVHRSFLLLPILLIVISYGIYELYILLKRYIPSIVLLVIFSALILFSYLNFIHFYFYRYPISSGEFYGLDNRVLANFVRVNLEDHPIEVYAANPRDAYTAMLYFLNDKSLIKNHLKNVQEFNQTDIYSLRNVRLTYGCPAEKEYNENTTYVIANDRSCLPGKRPVYALNNPKDEGPMFFIYNSNVCQDQTYGKWRRYKKVTDYQMETMDQSTFCRTWVASY